MKSRPEHSSNITLAALKIILGLYILLCLVIAGLNYGMAPKADKQTAEIISKIWLFYENGFKTSLIVVCSVLSLILLGKNRRISMRKRNFTGLIISALTIHIIAPLLTGTREVYYFSMPVPWSSLSVRIFDSSSPFRGDFISFWGLGGAGAIIIFVIAYNIFIFAGTLLFGRRLQCAQVCMFNGFAAEVFSEALPLKGKKLKKPGRHLRNIFTILRVLLFIFAVAVSLYAVAAAAGIADRGIDTLLSDIETWKYLSIELLMAMFFWVTLSGRGYCYYCPAGTLLAFTARLGGQKIQPEREKCISCGKCDRVCPMSVKIRKKAEAGIPVKSLDCVGCGHCIDECPTEAIRYSTSFLDLFNRSGSSRKA